MFGDTSSEWNPFFYIIAGVIYAVIIRYIDRLEKQYLSKKTDSDEIILAKLARIRRCSEFDIFQAASVDWNISPNRIQDNFNEYVIHGILPYYVRDFVRKNKQEAENYRSFAFGKGVPPWWLA
jgi:hypothetical protein